jgi:hypothetical protein
MMAAFTLLLTWSHGRGYHSTPRFFARVNATGADTTRPALTRSRTLTRFLFCPLMLAKVRAFNHFSSRDPHLAQICP